MDKHGIALAITSIAQPGVAFMPEAQAAAFARRCNDYAAALIAKHPKRFGCFGLLPMHDIDTAIAEARYCLETLRFDGISLFASYGEKFLGDAAFDPLLAYLDGAGAVVHIHPGLHPSSRSLELQWPGFMIEYPFDTTRAAVNLVFTGALERFANIRFILSHAGGTLPYLAWRLSVAPMIDKRLQQRTRAEIFASFQDILVRQRAGVRHRSHGHAIARRREGAHSVRQRLAVLQRAGRGRGSEGLHRAGLSRAECARDDFAQECGEAVSAACVSVIVREGGRSSIHGDYWMLRLRGA